MKFGRFQHQSRTFYGLVEGDRVDELDSSLFDAWTPTTIIAGTGKLAF